MSNYRIDHIAFRTLDKKKCVDFFVNALGYKEQETFEIYFNDEKTEVALCTALEPGNRKGAFPWTSMVPCAEGVQQQYVLEPEIFVSEGTPGSIVHEWASKRGGAGIHHIALQVPEQSTIEQEMTLWKEKGWAENGFSTETPIVCPELKQVFTKPSVVTGVIFELIERGKHGFCKSSVRDLMISTKGD